MRVSWIVITILLLLVLWAPQSRAANIALYDWAIHLDGTNYEKRDGNTLFSSFDDSAFDWGSGLGTFNATIIDPGTHTLIAFFDHEIVESINTFFNEYGKVNGSPEHGQSWEIDEPGYDFGDIYNNVLNGILDNTNGVPYTDYDDVSMGLGWDFTLDAGDIAKISFTVAEIAPSLDFYLQHIDPDSNGGNGASLYFSSSLNVIPEPTTMLLLGAGLIGPSGLSVGGRE